MEMRNWGHSEIKYGDPATSLGNAELYHAGQKDLADAGNIAWGKEPEEMSEDNNNPSMTLTQTKLNMNWIHPPTHELTSLRNPFQG